LEELRKDYPDRYFEDIKVVVGERKVQSGRWKHIGENDVALVFTEFKDLDALLRFLGKEYPEKYSEERELLEESRARITNLNQELGRWKELKRGEKLSIASSFENIANKLPQDPYAKDEDKIEARNRLRDCSACLRNNFLNPGAIRAILMVAYRRLGDRIETTEDIREKYEFRRYLLNGIRKEFKEKFRKVRGIIQDFSDRPFRVLDKKRRMIGFNFNFLRNVSTKPYTQYIERVDHIIVNELRFAIKEKNREKVKQAAEEIIDLADEILEHIEEQERKSQV